MSKKSPPLLEAGLINFVIRSSQGADVGRDRELDRDVEQREDWSVERHDSKRRRVITVGLCIHARKGSNDLSFDKRVQQTR